MLKINPEKGKLPEILAPAGTLDKLKYALEYGADAVYCGLPNFSLRARINDFTLPKLKQGVEYARARGKKAYLTFNIYAHERHLNKAASILKKITKINPDALIISDPGIINLAKKHCPKINIHLSTQANATNSEAVKFWLKQGVTRVILAREIGLKEIKAIHGKSPKIELEIFVHGAMCMAYSGRCLLSRWIVNRSANLGDCVQPCRWQYRTYLEDLNRPGNLIPIEEDKHGIYILNSKDLCLLEYLNEIKKAGVCSFKIEGRNKSVYYLANVIKIYRQAVDAISEPMEHRKKINSELLKELNKITNRGFSTGFLFGPDKFEQDFFKTKYESGREFVGEVVKVEKNRTYIKVHNKLERGDIVEVIAPRGRNSSLKISEMRDAKTGRETQIAHGGSGGQTIYVSTKNFLKYSLLSKE